MQRGTIAGASFSTLANVSTDDRGNRPIAAPKPGNAKIDPREESVEKRMPQRTNKRRVASTDLAMLGPIVQPTLDTVATPVIERNVSGASAPPVHLPPIRLEPDHPDEGQPVQEVTTWVPTVLAPTPATREATMLLETVIELDAELLPAQAPVAAGSQQTRINKGSRRPRRRVRRVTRVVRHVDPWSVFKVALVFSIVLYGVCLTAGVLLWNVAYTTGTIDNLQKFFESFGWSSFRFEGGKLFHNAWIAGLFAALGLTGLALLTATLFNLITDLVGGIRVTVLEEEVVERHPSTSSSLLRAPKPSAPAKKRKSSLTAFDKSVEQPG